MLYRLLLHVRPVKIRTPRTNCKPSQTAKNKIAPSKVSGEMNFHKRMPKTQLIIFFHGFMLSGKRLSQVSKEEMVNQIGIKKGELFNRIKLINAQRTLSEIGYFNPDKIVINPLPKQTPKGWIIDLEFVVEEK
ncbi:MAG: POTRA domain-containing protein [Spirosomataceae bacterium]